MQVTLNNLGKRYNREWIFRHIDLELHTSKRYAITGSNGSGKSTLLQVIAGALQHNEGTLTYHQGNETVDPEKIHTSISLAAPYLEMIEEMTALEMLKFHSGFKPLIGTYQKILDTVGLEKAGNKQIRYFSSGMKQRLKLAQAFFSDTPMVLLDEPTTNLDRHGMELYQQLIQNTTKDRLVIVCSNDPNEYGFCEEIISVEKYK
jgi:ABC-type multidrug transport system ATPase subunit